MSNITITSENTIIKKKLNNINDISINTTNMELATSSQQTKHQVVLNEDCIVGMKKIPDNYADLIICDPP